MSVYDDLLNKKQLTVKMNKNNKLQEEKPFILSYHGLQGGYHKVKADNVLFAYLDDDLKKYCKRLIEV